MRGERRSEVEDRGVRCHRGRRWGVQDKRKIDNGEAYEELRGGGCFMNQNEASEYSGRRKEERK